MLVYITTQFVLFMIESLALKYPIASLDPSFENLTVNGSAVGVELMFDTIVQVFVFQIETMPFLWAVARYFRSGEKSAALASEDCCVWNIRHQLSVICPYPNCMAMPRKITMQMFFKRFIFTCWS